MKNTRLSFLFVFVFLTISFFSCEVEIGLGSAVDTKEPEVTIQNPPAGSVIRDVFAMSGTCADDGTIMSIAVEFKQLDVNEGDEGYRNTFYGDFNQKDGYWECKIDPFDTEHPIPDGSYEATVMITDGTGKQTDRNRQYTIDNTAPILAITRPSCVVPEVGSLEDSTDFDSYGQDFVIEGHVSDTCERRYISVDIYDTDGNLKYQTFTGESEQLIKIDSDFSTAIASFHDDAYNAIYGEDDEAGTKKYSCAITVYDSAKKYPIDGSTPEGDDAIGNRVEYFYLYEGDLYNDVFDAYGMTNAYKLVNGSFSEDELARVEKVSLNLKPEEALSALKNTKYQETRGFLSLNPKNNPYFKVSGHEPFDKAAMEGGIIFDDTEHHIINNSTMVVEVYPGLDQTPLIQENLGLYLVKADNYGQPEKNADKIWLVEPKQDLEGKKLITDAEKEKTRDEAITKIGSTYKFTVYLSTLQETADGKFLESGSQYIIGVEGWDKKSVQVKNTDAIYGFQLVESGTAPVLTIKSIEPEWITTNVNTTENPDVVTENAAKKLSINLLFDGDDPYQLDRAINNGDFETIISKNDSYRESSYTDVYTPATGSGNGTLKYILTANNNLSSRKDVEYKVDNTRPDVISVTVPNVNQTENSSFKFLGLVNDNDSGIADVQIKFADEASLSTNEPLVTDWVSVGNSGSWNYNLVFAEDEYFKNIFADSTGKTIEGKKLIYVRAIDETGNISEVYNKQFIYDTNDPELKVTEYKQQNEEKKTISNNFFASQIFSIFTTITDNYGIDSVVVKQIYGEGANAIENEIENISGDQIVNGQFEIKNLPRNTVKEKVNEPLLQSGIFKYQIIVKDKTNEKKVESSIYNVTIDLEEPNVSITSPSTDCKPVLSENESTTISGSSFRFTGQMSDGTGTGITSYSYKFVPYGTDANQIAWITTKSTADNWSILTELSDGTSSTDASSLYEGMWTMMVKATDVAGNESEVAKRNFVVDKANPGLVTNITQGESCQQIGTIWYFANEVSGKITYSDTFGFASEKPYTFKLGNYDITNAVNVQNGNWSVDSALFEQCGDFADDFDFSSLENIEQVLTISVRDKVGKTNSTLYTIYKDTTAPVIGITYPVENDPISDANFTARGSVSDGTGVGIESLEYRVNDESEWTTINSGITGTSWTQNLNFSDKPEGNVTLYIRAKDKFGKLSTPTSVNFFYDKQNPQILLNSDDVYYVNSATYTLSGKAYDTNMLSYVTIADDEIIYSSSSTPAAVTLSDVSEAKSLETAATWSKVFTTGLNGNISEGSHTLKVLAYDSSNRVSSSLSKEIFVDTVAPVVSTVAIPAPSETEESYYQFSGTTSDDAGSGNSGSGSQNSSGVDKVLVKFSDGTKSTDWIEASGTTRWTLLVTYANEVYREVFGTEGSKTIFVKVIDKAGNESAEYSRNFIYDKAIPTVNISSYTVNGNTTLLGTRTSFDVRDVFSISGVAADSYALKKIEILQTKNTEDPVVIASITADGTNKEWTITDLPRAENSIGISGTSDVSTDATYKYAVKVYDNSSDEGKAAQSSTLAVRIDNTAPEVTVSTPSANLEKSQALAGSSYTFNGTVTDAGVGLEKYQYAFTTSATLPTEWETAYSETGLWQVEKALVSGTQPSSTALNEGQWYFWIKANDTAGNECTPVSRSFYVDLTKPTLSAAVTTNASCLLSSSIYYFAGENLTGTVSASDTYGLKSVTYKLGDDVITPVLSGENNNIWSIPSNKFTNGEIKTLTITAEDLVGKTSFQTFDISYDTSAPVVEIAESSLREGASVSSFPLTIYGTVNDGTGIGADTIYYSLDGSDPANTIILNGTSWSKEITDASYTEGEIALKLKIKDKLGNISSVNTINFYYDINTPELTETSVGESGLTTNSAITLGGTASDSNELASVVITDSFNSNSRWTIPAAVMTGNTWVKNISLGTGENQLADGTHNFTITATDIVGKTTKLTRSVVIDATIPEVAVTAPATRIYSKNSNYRFEGTASDNIGINSLTAKLFKVVEGGDDEEIQSNNVNVNAGNWNWTVYELDNSSTYYGKFIVEDVGNNTNEAISQIIIADYTAPNSTLNFNGTAINNNSTSITNSTYTLSGTIDEDNFNNAEGYATIKIDSGNPQNLTVTAEKTWTYTGITEEGTHSYVFRFKDLAGNESSYTVNVNYDTTAPETLTITTPATDDASGANAISGSTKTFSGNVSDASSGLASYSYAFTQSSTAPADSSTEWTTVNADNGTWSVSRTLVATTSAQAECLHEGEWYLYLKAEDKAGNKSQAATVRHFWVDQSAPALSEVNIVGNPYYFKDNNLVISGKAIDTFALDDNNAVVIKKGTETVASIGSADVGSDGSWSTTVTGIEADTVTELSIEVKDKVGKSSGVSTYRVYKDQTSPEISDVEPSSSAEMSYEKSQNYQFRGKTTDTNLAEARAVLYKDGSATTTTTVLSPDATGNWTWKVYDLDNASYNIKITAEDKAGNVSTYTTAAVRVDTENPESTLNGTGLYENDGTTTVTTLTSNGTATYYAKSAYTLSGVVTDDNFTYSAESVVVKENNTQVTVEFEGTAPGYTGWKYTPSITADGTYNYSITVKDKAENESTYNVTVVYDTTAPVVTISSPTSISYPSLDSANGNVSDNGIGIKSVKWSTDNSTWSENIWTGPLWNANLTSMEDEGSVTLYVKAEDWFGKETTTSVSFSLDKYNPSVSETDTVTEYQKADYSFTLSGEAGDTNAIDYISITDGTNVYATTAAADSTDAARLTAENAAVTIPVTNGSRDLTEESGKGKNWRITFSSTDAAPLAQGRHNFIITAKDTANKYATSITKDIFIDTIAPEVLSAVLPNGNSTENDSFTFTGTAKDNNNSSTDSKIAKVEVKFGSYASDIATTATEETEWLEANGGTSWKYQAVFTDESVNNVFGTNEGWKKITVRATDNAGNISSEYTSSAFLYDKGNPTTTINKYKVGSDEQPVTNGQSFFVNGNFKLNFTVNDGYQVSSVEIKQNGTVIETLPDVNLASQTITVENLPRNAENTALTLNASSSGSYVYTINVKDKANKSAAEAKVTAKIDLSKPTISITTPGSDPASSTTYTSGSSKTFSGTVSDPEISAGVAGAGVESYFYQFTQSETEPTSGWNTVSYTQNDWTLVKSLVSGTTLGANGELCEGEWYLWMYAVDKAGNESNKVKRHFWLDQNVPEFDTNQPTITEAITEVDSAVVKSGSTYYFNSGLSGTVSATDTSGKPVTYSYKIGEGAPVSISGTNWSIPSSSFIADGSYTVTITATDYCGRSTSKDFSVIRDTTAPEIDVISPSNNDVYLQSSITPKGSVYDSGVGVKQLYYYSTLTETTVEEAEELSDSEWTSLEYTGGASWSNQISLSSQGQVNFFIIAEDKLGQKTEPQKRVFYYDRDLPKVTQTTTVNEYQKENYSFTLKGKAWDSNSLDYVKITDGTNVYSSKDSVDSTRSARVTIGTTSTAKTEEAGATWSITFSSTDTVPLAQGNHSFKVVSVDTAGRASDDPDESGNRDVISIDTFVDSIKPQLSITTPTVTYTKASTITFTGTLTEANLDELTVKLYKEGTAEAITTETVSPRNGTWTYKATPEADGKYYITAEATDIAGNSSGIATTSENKVTVDYTAPTTTIVGTGLTTETAGTATVEANGKYYAKGAFTLSGNVTEKYLKSVKVNGTDVTPESGNAWTKTYAASDLTEGTADYTVSLEDEAGNTNSYKVTVTYDKTAPTTTVASNVTSGFTNGSSITYSGTITETNLYQAELTLIKDGTATGTTTTVDSKNWTWKVTDLEEGTYTVKAIVKDKAGNTNGTGNTGGSVTVDKTAPVTTVSGTNLFDSSLATATTLTGGSTYYAKAAYGLSGTVTEANFQSATYQIDSGTSQTLSNTWSLPAQTGTHKYTFKLKDKAGNEETYVIDVKYDNTAPVVTITTPAQNITDPNLAISSDEYSFRINATDGSGVGVKEIKYGFSSTSTTEPDAWVTDSNFSDGDKYFTMDVLNGTTGLDAEDGKLPEGTWYLWVKAKDRSGNEGISGVGTSEAPRKLIVDKSAPTLTVTQSLNETGTNALYNEVTASGYTISGTVSDTNAMATSAAVVVKVDGEEKLSTTDASWSYTIPKGTAAGTLLSDTVTQVEITAKDVVGKTTTKKYTLYYDTKAPELEVSSPAANEQVEYETKVIKGTVSDAGFGLAKLEFELRDSSGKVVKDSNGKEIKGSSDSTNAGNYPITIKGEQWYYAGSGTSATTIPLGTTEGALKLYVKATENASASRTTVETIDFYYDKENPVIEETGIGTTGKTTNTNFTFEGTAYDTNALAKIEIKEGLTVVATTEGTTPKITCENMATAKSAATEATWTATIDASSIADGVHTYTVVATDKAGRETKQNRTIKYDKTNPTITSAEITQTGGVTIESNTWYKTSQIAISTKVTDNLSGIASVEYSTNNTNWYSLTKDSTDSTKWTGLVSCTEQGKNDIYIKVTDNAGNATDNIIEPLKAYIDTVAPDSCDLISVDGDETFTSGQKLVNGKKTVSVVLELKDNEDTTNGSTGIKTVQLLKSGTPSTATTAAKGTDNKWTVTIAITDLSSGGVNFRVTDNVGNYADFSPFTILEDKTAPTLVITPIIDADKSTEGTQVNGKITISGTASDNQALEKVELGYNTTGGDTYIPLGTVSGTTSWSLADIDTTDTTKFTANAITSTGVTVYIQAKATDKAGNEKTVTTSFIIKQDTDRPVIKLTNLDLSDTNKTSDEYWYKNEELMFTITDDDGAIVSSAEDATDATVQISLDGGTTYNGVTFDGLGQYTISSNGSKTVYFKVTDNAGKTFTTNAASTTYTTFGPKITDKTNSTVYGYTNASDIIKIKVDTQAPEISNTYYLIGELSDADLTAEKLEDPENNGWTSLASFGSAQLGGNQTLNVLFYATDTSGIESVSSKFAGFEVASGNTLYNEAKSNDATTKIIVTKFDVSTILSGTQSLQLKATDKAGMTSNIYERFAVVDNAKPTVNCSNYNDDDLVYGSSQVNVRGLVTDSSNVNKIEIAFTKDTTEPSSWTDVSTYMAASSDANFISWTLLFDGTTTPIEYAGVYNTKYMNDYIYDLYDVTDTNKATYSTISDIYIWVRATDIFGNVSEATKVKLRVNPIADRPTLNFTYPTVQADGSLQSIGGVIRVTGTTEISDPNAYVAAVVLQIDPNYQTSFSTSWNTDLGTIISNKSVSNYAIVDTSSLWATAEDPLYGLSNDKKADITNTIGSKVIKTLGSTTSWNLTLNMKSEFADSLGKDAEDNDIYRKLGLRAYAISSTGRVTDAQTVVAQMDPASPLFGNEKELRLVQYDTDGTTEIASRKYEAGLYLSGHWYLVGTVTDTSGIKLLTLDGEDIIADGEVQQAYSSYVSKYEMDYDNNGTPDTNGYNGYYNWELKIPVGVTTADDFGTKTYTLVAMEAATEGKTSTQIVTINYDNKAPDFTATEKSEIYNSDGAARFEGTIGEDGTNGKNQSGVSKVAMYFTRTLSGVTSIIDPLADGGTSGKDNFITSTELTSKNGLYWRSATASSISGSEIQLSGAVPENIRPGSLVMINNVIYVIKSIDFNSNKVTVKDSTLATSTNESIYFAVAQVIDNTSAEAGTTTVFDKARTDPTINGDGDWMVESLNMSNGTRGTWYAIYDSTIIMDGPVTVHYVAFDKAGNTTTTSFNARVMNNAPRIAGVIYGTDENGNGTVEEDELKLTYQGYYTVHGSHVYNADLAVNGKKIDGTKVTTLDVANRLTVKGNIEVKPDIVGGNIGLGYTYTYTDKNATPQTTDFTEYSGVGHATGDAVRTDDLSIEVSLETMLEKEIPDGQQTMTFKVWDKTDGSTEGVDSNNITINIPVNVVLKDSEAPKAYIIPFHWTSSTDNSLYENSLANGHIDLEGDLPEATFKDSNTGVYDKDPKVSGKIIVDGYATDNVIVKKLTMKLPGYNSDNEFDIATRQNDGTWKSEAGTDSPWSFELVSDEYADDGLNTVTFKVMIDTEESISTVAATDVEMCLYAVDRGSAGLVTNETTGKKEVAYGSYSGTTFTAGDGKTSTLVTTQTTTATNTPYYKMDIVPYIKGVERNAGYNTHRSGMGLYPLIRGETTNSITGFNLKGASDVKIGNVSLTIEDNTTNTIKFSIQNENNTYYDIVDGGIQVTNQVVSLNNVNNNTVEYNSEAVSATDTRWTDDRFASIWECDDNDKFAAKYPTYPSMDMGTNGDLFMSYTFYSKSVVYYNQLLSENLIQVFTAGDQPEETDIMVNGQNDVNIIYQANQHYGGGQGNWTANVGSGAGSINLYNSNAPNCTSYAKGRYWRFEGFWHNQMLQQHKNAKVATSGNNIYHTIWYDKITHAIKYSNVTSNNTTKGDTYKASASNNNNRGYPEIGWVVIDGDSDLDDVVQRSQQTTSGYDGGESNYPDGNWTNSYLNGKDGTAMYSIALGKTKAQKEAIMNTADNATRKTNAINNNGSYNIYDYSGNNTGDSGYNFDCYEGVDPCSVCGQYAAIAVTSDGYPVIVYYDVDHNMLKVARGMGTDPKGLNTQNQNNNASLWRVQEVPLTSGHLGNDANYIGAVIDSNGYLHIVFQNSRGQLIYTRSTNTASNISTTQGFTFNNGSVIVDENGTWADITLDSNNVPHISYMAGTSGYDTLKLAYCSDATWTNALKWETVYAPMNAKSSNVKTCVVARPSNKTGGQTTSNTSSYWKAGIGFSTEEDYRVMKYIGSGEKVY